MLLIPRGMAKAYNLQKGGNVMPLLEIEELYVSFQTEKGKAYAVNGVSYALDAGRTLCVVGESGSGKSVSAMSILGLLDPNGKIERGEIRFDGKRLDTLSLRQLREVRGNEISMIFQEPMTSLNPVFTVSRQLSEPLLIHRHISKGEAKKLAADLLFAVQIPDPQSVMKRYPHELSGGMRQRVMIAMALACRPKLLIADEPTTALDVTVQAQILQLMKNLKRERNTALLFITHDLGIVNEMADDVAVMYCGQVVEATSKKTLFTDCPQSHPYTEGLMESLPDPRRQRLVPIAGNVPHPLELPKGCKFAPRCKYATQKCVEEEPALFAITPHQRIRCFYPQKEERRSAEHKKITIHR